MFFQRCFIQEWKCTNIQVHIYNMPFEMIFIYPFITYQAGRVRAGVPTKAVENQIFFMPRTLVDTATGLEIRNRKSGARGRASSFGAVQSWPEPQQSFHLSNICIWSLGTISGIAFTLWLLVW